MEIISLKSAGFKYANANTPAVDNVNCVIKNGDFCIICGMSGSGKSTLLSMLFPPVSEKGEFYGEIDIMGNSVLDFPHDLCKEIAYVGQSAKDSIVCEKVWQELAFALECNGADVNRMHSNVAELASYFGLHKCFADNVESLSGGQQKILSVASAMAVHPKILILDEPFSSLDKNSAVSLAAILRRINRELGVTLIVAEHDLTEIFDLCSKIMILDKGKIEWFGKPCDIGEYINANEDYSVLPAQLKIWGAALRNYPITLSVSQCSSAVEDFCCCRDTFPINVLDEVKKSNVALRLSRLKYKYEKESDYVIDNLSLDLHYGRITALIGENAAGKSTLLKLILGDVKPQYGKTLYYKCDGTLLSEEQRNVAYMPQDVRLMFTQESVMDELKYFNADEGEKRKIVELFGLRRLLEHNPLDLSGGEKARLALALILLKDSDIILLDEPTNGLDKRFCEELSDIIKQLANLGKAILIVSHDLDFCAECADECAFMFRGSITSLSITHDFFIENILYTTTAARISNGNVKNAITDKELIYALTGKSRDKTLNKNHNYNEDDVEKGSDEKPEPRHDVLCSKRNERGNRLGQKTFVKLGYNKHGSNVLIGKKSLTITLICLILMPLSAYLGLSFFGDDAFLPISILIMILASIPFFASFENRKPPASEITILAVLSAAAVASRIAFYFLPQVKPVAAIVIITGVAFGSQSGFMVGSLSMLISNVFFGQGPWTPWQMFAMGLVGFFAGFFGRLKISRFPLATAIFGFLSTLIIYGGIVNPSSAIITHQPLNFSVISLFYIQGLPMDLIHAASSFLFLLFFTNPFMRILDRAKLKFAI